MADISTWSTTPGSNNATPPDGWPENMAASDVNNTARQQMADLKTWYNRLEWSYKYTAIYSSATVFTTDTTVTNDAGEYIFEVNRRVRIYRGTTGDYLYGTITALGTRGASGSVTVSINGGTSLTNEALTVYVSINSVMNSAIPWPWIDLRSFGAYPGGASSDALFNAFSGDGTHFVIQAGSYTLDTQQLDLTGKVEFNLECLEGVATIDVSAVGGVILSNTPKLNTTLSSDITKGDRLASLTSVVGVAEGDFIIIRDTTDESFSSHRTYYRQGDICKVIGVSGSNVTLDIPIECDVPSATSEVVVVTPVHVTMKNVHFVNDQVQGAGTTLLIEYAYGELENVKTVGGDVGIRPKHCIGLNTKKGGSNVDFVSAIDGYGFSPLSCKFCTHEDEDHYCTINHAADFSGGGTYGIPSRWCTMRDSRLTGSSWSASLHGWAEYCGYENCVSDGVILGGRAPFYRDGVARCDVDRLNTVFGVSDVCAVRGTEMVSADFDVSGTEMFIYNDSASGTVTVYGVKLSGSAMIGASTLAGGLIDLRGCKLTYAGTRATLMYGVSVDASSASAAVQSATTVHMEDMSFDFGSGTATRLWVVGSVQRLITKNITSDESQHGGRVITSTPIHETKESSIQVLSSTIVSNQAIGTSPSVDLLSLTGEAVLHAGIVNGYTLQVQAIVDGVTVCDTGSSTPRGDDSAGVSEASYILPKLHAKSSLIVRVVSYSGSRNVGALFWHEP